MLPAKEAMQERAATETEQERVEGGETAGDVCIELHMRAEDFEKFFATLQQLPLPLKLEEKTRIVIEYNPKKKAVSCDFFKIIVE